MTKTEEETAEIKHEETYHSYIRMTKKYPPWSYEWLSEAARTFGTKFFQPVIYILMVKEDEDGVKSVIPFSIHPSSETIEEDSIAQGISDNMPHEYLENIIDTTEFVHPHITVIDSEGKIKKHPDEDWNYESEISLPSGMEWEKEPITADVGYLSPKEIHETLPESVQNKYPLLGLEEVYSLLHAESTAQYSPGSFIHIVGDRFDAIRMLRRKELQRTPLDLTDANIEHSKQLLEEDRSNFGKHRTALTRLNGIYILIGNAQPLNAILGFPNGRFIYSANGLIVPTASIDDKIKSSGTAKPACHIVMDVNEGTGYAKSAVSSNMRFYYALMDQIWRNFVVPACERVVTDYASTPDEAFPADKTEVKLKGIQRQAMVQLFGRATTPQTEQDVITAHHYWRGKHFKQSDTKEIWVHTGQDTPIDAAALHEGAMEKYDDEETYVPQRETDYYHIEYKIDFDGKSKYSIMRQHVKGVQTFSMYEIAVVWQDPSATEVGNWKDQRDLSQFKLVEKVACSGKEKKLFPPNCQYWIQDNQSSEMGGSHGAFVLSLEKLWKDKVAELEKAAEAEADAKQD